MQNTGSSPKSSKSPKASSPFRFLGGSPKKTPVTSSGNFDFSLTFETILSTDNMDRYKETSSYLKAHGNTQEAIVKTETKNFLTEDDCFKLCGMKVSQPLNLYKSTLMLFIMSELIEKFFTPASKKFIADNCFCLMASNRLSQTKIESQIIVTSFNQTLWVGVGNDFSKYKELKLSAKELSNFEFSDQEQYIIVQDKNEDFFDKIKPLFTDYIFIKSIEVFEEIKEHLGASIENIMRTNLSALTSKLCIPMSQIYSEQTLKSLETFIISFCMDKLRFINLPLFLQSAMKQTCSAEKLGEYDQIIAKLHEQKTQLHILSAERTETKVNALTGYISIKEVIEKLEMAEAGNIITLFRNVFKKILTVTDMINTTASTGYTLCLLPLSGGIPQNSRSHTIFLTKRGDLIFAGQGNDISQYTKLDLTATELQSIQFPDKQECTFEKSKNIELTEKIIFQCNFPFIFIKKDCIEPLWLQLIDSLSYESTSDSVKLQRLGICHAINEILIKLIDFPCNENGYCSLNQLLDFFVKNSMMAESKELLLVFTGKNDKLAKQENRDLILFPVKSILNIVGEFSGKDLAQKIFAQQILPTNQFEEISDVSDDSAEEVPVTFTKSSRR